MKIERLVGILAVLLQKDRVSAGELADRFEVSTRTVFRDIDSICMAGIPIAASRGANGGIYIMDGYKIDKPYMEYYDFKTKTYRKEWK